MYIVKSGSLPVSPGPAPAAVHCEALGSDPTHSNPGRWFLGEAVSPSSKGSLGGPGLPMRFPLGAFGGLRKRPATLYPPQCLSRPVDKRSCPQGAAACLLLPCGGHTPPHKDTQPFAHCARSSGQALLYTAFSDILSLPMTQGTVSVPYL